MAEREIKVLPPRPAFESLPAACFAAITHGNTLVDIRVPRWAQTYGCSEEQVKAEWERQMWIHTQKPVEESYK